MSAPLDLTRAPATDPLGIYRFRDGLYAVDLIAAAITEFDLFTKLVSARNTSGMSRKSNPRTWPRSAATSARIAVRPT